MVLNKIRGKLNDPFFREKIFKLLFPVRNFRILYGQHFVRFNPDVIKRKPLIFLKVFSLQFFFWIPVLIYNQYLNLKLSKTLKIRGKKGLRKKEVKKIGVYSPWFDKFAGGGEKVSAIIALYFEERFPDAEIEMIIDDFLANKVKEPATLDEVYQKYGVRLKRTIFKTYNNGYNQFFHIKYYYNFLNMTQNYDIFVNCFMNLLPAGSAISLHYVHFPLESSFCISRAIFERYRESYHLFITNSEYTNQWTHKRLNVKNTKIIYPHIDIPKINQIPEKSNIILTVSRLSSEKKIDIMIDTFQKNEELFKDYEFHIVGAENPINKYYIDNLKSMVKNDRIKFFPNLSVGELNQKYMESKIYWNAMGYGISFDDPFAFEHFGLTVAESMSFGLVPIVIDYGGPAEIVKKGNCGLTWLSIDDLVNQTIRLIRDDELYKKLQSNAISYSRNFSRDSFFENFDEVFSKILHD